MRILGIDPGIGRMGWGIIDIQGTKLITKAYGCLETPSTKTVPDRLVEIHSFLTTVVDKYEPGVLAIEELFFGSNAKTAFVVGQARGVILLLAAEYHLEVEIYTPLQVKIALTGYGRAEKAQVGKMVKTLLNLPHIPKPDDTADALAVAITHAFSFKVKREFTK